MTQVIGFDVTPLAITNFSGVSTYTQQLLEALVARRDDRCYVPLAHRSVIGHLPDGAADTDRAAISSTLVVDADYCAQIII